MHVRKRERTIPILGFTIQAGAFAEAENAVLFADKLRQKGLDATYFVTKKGLYRVTFGNFKDRTDAESVAAILKSVGVIDDYYIVSPEQYAATKAQTLGEDYLREEITLTSKRFIGIPYLWGGTSPEEGFDCSGFTMTVYRLNGLDLPRTSQMQFEIGEPVNSEDLKKGDLVFFATRGGKKVSHVGIYLGNGKFVHAPGQGKKIRIDSLNNKFYARKYVGARSYL
ncbi:MAG: NlpC/P60 family protein [Syntrophales bacterium]|nr:NlpC/P60 family protein [Syntrophales bacterium]